MTEEFIKEYDKTQKINFLHFEKSCGLLERAYSCAHKTKDDEIIIFLDERAYLSKSTILEQINAEFKNFDIWLLYGSCFNDKTKRLEKAINTYPSKLFTCSARSLNWRPCLLKAFYSSLFKKVSMQDFFFRGKFFSSDFDASYMFPLIELSKNHTKYISKSICSYLPKETKDFLPCDIANIKCRRKIRFSKSYKSLKNLTFNKEENEKKADMIIFSYHRPLQLYALLESIEKYVKGLEKISVIYRCDEEKYKMGYEKLKKRFKTIHFILQSSDPKKDFKPLLLKTIKSSNKFLIFSVDDIIFKDHVDMTFCINNLQKTKSYFFSLRLGDNITYHYMDNYNQPIPHHVMLFDQIMGWHIDAAKGDFFYPTSVDVTIYRKKDILDDFSKISFDTPNTLEINWFDYYKKKHLKKDRYRTGLSFVKSKAVNIPFNLVNISQNRNMEIFSTDFLLDKFNKNFILDISSIEKTQNFSVHMEIEPKFLKDNEKSNHH